MHVIRIADSKIERATRTALPLSSATNLASGLGVSAYAAPVSSLRVCFGHGEAELLEHPLVTIDGPFSMTAASAGRCVSLSRESCPGGLRSMAAAIQTYGDK